MKKIKMVMVICSIVFFYALLPLAAAEIFLGQAADLYNFGDELIMNATLVEKLNTNGFFSVVLECPQGSVEIYKTSQNVEGGKQKSISFSSGFNKAIIGNLSGVCSLSASYS